MRSLGPDRTGENGRGVRMVETWMCLLSVPRHNLGLAAGVAQNG